MSLIQDLTYSEKWECHVGKTHLALFDTDIEVMFDEEVPIDYVETCIEHFNSLSSKMIQDLSNRLLKYCQFMQEEWQAMSIYEELAASIQEQLPQVLNTQNILQYVSPNMLVVEKPKDNIPAYSLDCNCVWEPEHGAEIIIKDNEVLYVGPFLGIGPWENIAHYKCEY